MPSFLSQAVAPLLLSFLVAAGCGGGRTYYGGGGGGEDGGGGGGDGGGSACGDTKSDPANCGGCGKTCRADESCVLAHCYPKTCNGVACRAGLACCDDGCKDVAINADHCGFCGNACAPGELCTDGVCGCGATKCAGTQGCCGGACIELKGTDNGNCGGCGVACTGKEHCEAGMCVGPYQCECNQTDRPCANGDSCILGCCSSNLDIACQADTMQTCANVHGQLCAGKLCVPPAVCWGGFYCK